MPRPSGFLTNLPAQRPSLRDNNLATSALGRNLHWFEKGLMDFHAVMENS